MIANSLWVPVYLFLQMCVVWLIYRRTHNPSVVDVFWGVGLVVAGFISLWPVTQNLRLFITAVLLFLWGARLSVFLWVTRIRTHTQDKRYQAFSKQVFLNFQIQALLCWIISAMFLSAKAALIDTVTWMDVCAYVVIVLGITGETIADVQLWQFRKANPGKVCEVGWWRLSRHPNLFFDWVTWCGFYMVCAQSAYGWLGLVSPLCLYWVMNKLTMPVTERYSVEAKGDAYRQYQKNTSPFFPMSW